MMALQANSNTPSILLKNKADQKVVSIAAKKPTSRSSLAGSVTEIVVQDDNFSNIPMLMPLLAQLSQDDRWFVWIAPPVLLPKQQLLDAGIDLNKVILLNPDNKHSTYALAKQALSTGTSHSVISWPGYLSEEELNELEDAAKIGQSHGIIIRRRQHS